MLFYASSEPILTLKCKMQVFVKQYCAYFILAVVIAILLYVKIRQLKFNQKVQSVSKDLFRALKDELEASGVAGISEKDMIKKYQAMPSDSAGIGRDESTFRTLVMPLLEQFRRKDRDISVIERV